MSEEEEEEVEEEERNWRGGRGREYRTKVLNNIGGY